jgi:acetate kinase
MGFSALDGLPMGTRCGELDPGVVLHLLDREAMSAREIEDLLYRRSGMLGLSGISSDFRDLLASPDPRARFALEVFVYRVARGIGSLAAAMGGLDGIVFTAGALDQARDKVRSGLAEHGSLTVAAARDLLGSSRKYVLAILARLDAEGVTRRRGDERFPGPKS